MNNTSLRTSIVTLLTIALFKIGASQGLYWETVTANIGNDSKPQHSKYSYLPGMIMRESMEKNSATIYLLDKHLVYSVNHKKKTYAEKTYYELDRSVRDTRTSIENKRNLMQERLLGMSQEDREKTEKMMEENMPGQYRDIPIRVIQADSTKMINNYRCVKYEVWQGEKILQILWTTTETPNYQLMRNDLMRYTQRIASMNAILGKSMSEALKNTEGFPIRAEIVGKTTATVTIVEQRSIHPSAFEIPAGYKKEEPKSKK